MQAGALQILHHGLPGGGAVPLLQRMDQPDVRMFGRAGVGATVQVAHGGAALEPQQADEAGQHGLLRGFDDGEVEALVGDQRGVVVHGNGFFQVLVQPGEGVDEALARMAAGGGCGGAAFQFDAQSDDFHVLLHAEHGHGGHAAVVQVQGAFGGQALYGIAHGRGADAELFGQAAVYEALRGLQLASHDGVTDLQIGFFGKGLIGSDL